MSQQFVDIGGAKLWTTLGGSGPAIVLCHGGPGNFDTLGPVAAMVSDLATVYRYDQRACGRSTGDPPFTVDRFVEDLEELRRYWNEDRLIVGGHSWGANLALAYCLKYPERAKALIYISGPGISWDWQKEFKASQRSRLSASQQMRLNELKQARHKQSNDNNISLSTELLRLLYAADLADVRNADLLDQNGLFAYPMNWTVNSLVNEDWIKRSGELQQHTADLQFPILVVHGELDPRPLSIATNLRNMFANCKLATLPGVGHLPWIEEPRLLRTALREFLATLD